MSIYVSVCVNRDSLIFSEFVCDSRKRKIGRWAWETDLVKPS